MATRPERHGVRQSSRAASWAVAPIAALVLVALHGGAAAQVWKREAKVEASAIATTNGAGRPSGFEESDLLLSLMPGLRIAREAADYSFSVNGSVELVSSAEGTRESRALPRLEATLNSTLVDRLLFFDAVATIRQVEADPFLGRGSAGLGDNLRRTEYVQLSPYLRHEFSPRISFNARLDETYTSVENDSAANVKVHAARASLDGRPEPLGFGLEVQRQDTRYVELANSSWKLDSARASLHAKLFDELIVSVIAGKERTTSELAERTDDIRGVGLNWVPSPRTQMEGRVERRFFGKGFNARVSHRTSFLSFSASAAREPVSSTSSLGAVAGGDSLGDFLDAILTSRYPDPGQRAALVEGLLASRGLPTQLARALELLAGYAQLRTGGNATVAYLSPRTTASMTVFAQSLRFLTTDDAQPIAAVALTDDARQGGVEFNVSYLLTRQSRIGLRGRWLQVRGLGVRDGERTTDRDLRLLWSVNLSPRTEVAFGPYWRHVATNSATATTFRETAAQAVLTHRF